MSKPDPTAALAAACDALGEIMLSLQARALLARGIRNDVLRASAEERAKPDAQLAELAANAFGRDRVLVQPDGGPMTEAELHELDEHARAFLPTRGLVLLAKLRATLPTAEEREALVVVRDILVEIADKAGLDGRIEERGDLLELVDHVDRVIARLAGKE